ncbi:MAG: hypothetical protein JJ902_05360 [Roseibium sp.]|nr:hypothetical protein [Roseibium sp.]
MSLTAIVESIPPEAKRGAIPAFRLFAAYCGGTPPPRVPGMDTVLRLSVRIAVGRTPEEAAAKEYLYRWRLALQSPVFGAPHPIGL